MEGYNLAGVFQKKPALGDITNQIRKRGSTLVSGHSGNMIVEDNEGNSLFTKRACQGVENIVKEKCATRSFGNENVQNKSALLSPKLCSEMNSHKESILLGIPKEFSEIKESDNADVDNVLEVNEATGDNCTLGILLPVATETLDGVKENCDKEEQDPLSVVDGCSQTGESVTEICRKDVEDIPACNFTTGKHGMIEFSAVPVSHVPGSFKLGKCNGTTGGSCSNPGAGIDLLKSCPCSFCVKAAYIWSDLHYQDIKGRIAALKKSQREASSMRERSCRYKGIEKQSQGNLHAASKLESDLTGQWRSLFLHMESTFEREGNQLETSLQSLKDVRDNFKTDLEIVNGMRKEKH